MSRRVPRTSLLARDAPARDQDEAAPDHEGAAPVGGPGTDPLPPSAEAHAPHWVVVEVGDDGTFGSPRRVPAQNPEQAVATARCLNAREVQQLREVALLVESTVGAQHIAEGRLHLAAAAFLRGTTPGDSSPARIECRGRLAHVLAMQGDLRRAEALASVTPRTAPPCAGPDPGPTHARTALAWASLQHADFAEVRQLLGPRAAWESSPWGAATGEDLWLTTGLLLVESQLLVATGEPEVAVRLLAAADEAHRDSGWPPGLTDLLTIARSEALLATGDAHRAMAALTPMPLHARSAAEVLIASSRHRIGDVRGARSVLAKAQEQLDGEPLATQVRAWLLESRLAEERGELEQAEVVLDRALRAASSEELRLPLLQEWGWIKHRLDRDPLVAHAHRRFVASCDLRVRPAPPSTHFLEPAPGVQRVRSADPPAAPLTTREEEVLQLLAQMYSTEEIAVELFISINTVKTHLKGIFGKLCVSRRVDAVRRGRQLDLC